MHCLHLFTITLLATVGTSTVINRVTAVARIKRGQPHIINNITVSKYFRNTTTDIFRNCSDEDVVLSSLPYLEEKTQVTLTESLSPCGEDCVGLIEWPPCNNVKVNIPPFASEITMSILQKGTTLPGRKTMMEEFIYVVKGVLELRLVSSQPRYGLNLFNTGVFLYEDKVYTNTMLYLPKNSYVQYRAEQQGTIFYTLTDEQLEVDTEGNINTAW
jgi:hypothetical protein